MRTTHVRVTTSATDTLLSGVGRSAQSLHADNDGLHDSAELNTYNTDPNYRDSDGDGVIDGQEVLNGTDPLLQDTDGDGDTDGQEANAGTNPLDPESNLSSEEEAPKGCASTQHPGGSFQLLTLLGALLFWRRRK